MSAKQSTLEEFGGLEDPEVHITGAASRGSPVYHTDETCRHVTEDHKPVTLSSAKDRGFEECMVCRGECNHGDSTNRDPCGAPTVDGGTCENPALSGIGACPQHLDHTTGGRSDE